MKVVLVVLVVPRTHPTCCSPPWEVLCWHGGSSRSKGGRGGGGWEAGIGDPRLLLCDGIDQ